MPDFLKNFDGSGRKPRDVQVTALKWIAENWDSRILCLNAPVASGKSAISASIALLTGAHVITPSNILVDQYSRSYPNHNILKGRTHYSCHGIKNFSCQEWVDISGEAACRNCPYEESRERAFLEPTFFNPMSLYYLSLQAQWTTPSTIIVDEAHTLSGMILQLCGMRLPRSEYRFKTTDTHELALVPYLNTQLRRLGELHKIYKSDHKRLSQVLRETQSLTLTLRGLTEDAQNYAVWTNAGNFRGRPDQFLNIRPITPPQYMVKKLLNTRQRIILMSGTLLEADFKDLIGAQPYRLLDLPSPIPLAQRRIIYSPMPFPLNKDTPGDRIVHEIEAEIKKRPPCNTIVHMTYALSKRLYPQFRIPIIANDQDNKEEILAQFRKNGGVFLAAGCAEGIDLADNQCRLNIIPKLPFPDLADPVVSKRRAVEGGDLWYAMQTFKTLIQQCGRSTRHEKDHSVIVIKDPNFARMYQRYKSFLPQSFKEAIQWSES